MDTIPVTNHRYYDGLPAETLIVSGWYSTCNNCRKQTVNFETHDMTSGYGPSVPACGVVFKYVSFEYGFSQETKDRVAPHLEYVPLFGATNG